MPGFSDIIEISISYDVLNEAIGFLRYTGSRQLEAVALFAGRRVDERFEVITTIIPKQSSISIEGGLMYAVGSEELHRINVWLYENDYELIAQIHSHPRAAYHSEMDDRFPIVDTIGGVSIVVPDFAVGEISLEDWAIYRLSNKAIWELMSLGEIDSLIKLEV